MTDLVREIQHIYDREINASIEWFWDSGFHVRLGDAVNGWKAETTEWDFGCALDWLVEQAEKYWPEER